MKHMIYLDHAAATPIHPVVLKAMQPYFSEQFYNPSALYLPAQKVASALADARHRVAQLLGAKPAEIIFTAGGTEANNLAIQGIMQRFPKGELLTSAIEHESVLKPAELFKHHLISVQPDGRVDLKQLKDRITPRTVLISVMYANNEIGTIEPIKEVAELVKEVRKARAKTGNKLPLYLHTDACQAANYLDLHVSRLEVDLMTLNGGKIYGPKQSGVLYIRAGVEIEPMILGGGQEKGLRSGTENVAAAVGFAKALELAQSKRHAETKRLRSLQQEFFNNLTHTIPSSVINGSLKQRLPNNLHITLPGQDNERLLIKLEEKGILGAAGSACSASSEEPSHVLAAIGLTDKQAQASLRFTMGQTTTKPDLTGVIAALAEVTK